MKCEKIIDLIADYRSDILDSRTCKAIEQHLAQCEGCMQELKEFDAVMAMVDENTSQSEPPVGLWNGVYNKITAPEPSKGLLDKIPGWWNRKPLQALGTGVATLALIAGVLLGTANQETKQNLDYAALDNKYVQAHALSAGAAPLADRASLVSFVAMSEESGHGEH